jgi:hypothetical protein
MGMYLLAGTLGGVLLVVLDALLNANPLAVKLLAVYKPIARERINLAAGIIIDFGYGFSLAALFFFISPLLAFAPLPVNGLLFGAGIWFLRVAMAALSNWMMFAVPLRTVAYQTTAGLLEMCALGVLYALLPVR